MPRPWLLVALVGLAYAQAPQFAVEGRVTYAASYPLGRWEGTNTTASGQVRWEMESGALEGRICVDLRAFNSGNPLRDADSRGVFEVNKYPQSCFQPIRLLRQGEAVSVVGILELHGVSREIRIAGSLSQEGAAYRFRGVFETRFSEWNLERPSLIFVRVDDPVQVRLEARVEPVWTR
ncbi:MULTISPECIES: YceI family protein [unclassified Meiothermus]|uniref:YceI family protein n=1 Tax=unclassified Meiothermus TaxID=370471 RepID=UPI000D7D1764|nr:MULTISPECIES: YceI family protein [unclassified Meiothermus]PZA08988.1 YceI family protein [Meiothermus sp. Pnk-1]RYM40629.1 YceI family protein [Meiothermus sp. PNK-Is4]